jgi:hypothetical protein
MTYPAAGNSIPLRRARISPALSRGYRSGNSIPRHRDRINSCRVGCNTGLTSYPTRGKRCLARSIRRPRTLKTYLCASVIATAHAKPLQSPCKRGAMAISTQTGCSSESNFTIGTSHCQFSSDDRSCRMQRRVRASGSRKATKPKRMDRNANSRNRISTSGGIGGVIGAIPSPRPVSALAFLQGDGGPSPTHLLLGLCELALMLCTSLLGLRSKDVVRRRR